MTQADDIDTLNQASMRFMSDANVFAMTQPNLVVTHKAFAILCRAVASLMAGGGEKQSAASLPNLLRHHAKVIRQYAEEEGQHEDVKEFDIRTADYLEQAAAALATPSSGEFERGWNAAIESAIKSVRLRQRGVDPYNNPAVIDCLSFVLLGLSAFRKPAQEEVK